MMYKRKFQTLLGFVVVSAFLSFANDLGATKTVNVVVVGTGFVGGSLLEQIEKRHAYFVKEYDLDIRVVGIANSRSSLIDPNGVDLKNWRTTLTNSGDTMDWAKFSEKVLNLTLGRRVFVDCTSNQPIADSYSEILHAGISIATPNKKAASGNWASYETIRDNPNFLFDANVGAALPIVNTIQGLRRAGDEIVRIEGVFSGTLSYLFNSFAEGTSFSEIVKDAQSKGYTEPDPRDDLNGMDAARKLLILARESGAILEMADVEVKRFLPDDCFAAPSIEAFYGKLASLDAALSKKRDDALAEGKRLRYIASFENGKAQLSLQSVGPDHPFYNLSGTDNIVAITTKYFNKSPLVIKGPGAGPEVTAARVLENVVRTQLAEGVSKQEL